jgi:membrane protein DedA with SNARE-associated domain
VAVAVAGTIANALAPTLIRNHPLLLIALDARNRFLVLVVNDVDLVPFVVVGLLRRIVSDPLFFLLGYLYGESAVRWIERRMGGGGRAIRFTERWFARAAPVMVFLFPGALVCVLAGATGMPPALFLVLNVTGTVAALLVLYQFGEVFSGPIETITDFIDRNYLSLTVVTIVLTVGWVLWDRRRPRPEIQTLDEMERELLSESGDDESPPPAS